MSHQHPATSDDEIQLPVLVRRRSMALFDQQLWCWGCDVRRSEGNLLLAYGFERRRPPTGKQGTSCYIRDADIQIRLWGFGMFYGQVDIGGIFLKRYEFAPRYTPVAKPTVDLFSPQLLPDWLPQATQPKVARTRYLLRGAVAWICDYEAWILDNYGLPYRAECLTQWHKNIVCPAADIITGWQQIMSAL